MSTFESVSKTKQGEGTQRQTLSDVCKVPDGLTEVFDSCPTRGTRLHLKHVKKNKKSKGYRLTGEANLWDVERRMATRDAEEAAAAATRAAHGFDSEDEHFL